MRTRLSLGIVVLLFSGCSGSPAVTSDGSVVVPDLSPDRRITPAEDRSSRPEARIEAGPDAAIHFPRDEAPHSTPIEWWYYTGTLKTDANETYGFEQVVFQTVVFGIVGYMSHFAITDLKKGTYSLGTKTSLVDQRGALGGFILDVGGWKMSGQAGKDTLSANLPGYVLQLSLTAKKPVVLQYGKGWMTVGSTSPFYYYSYTRMGVTGLLTVDGQAKSVTGEAWMDHQWGEIGTDYKGWDWYSLRLDDSTEVMLFTVRKNGQSGFSGGTFIDAAGLAEELKAEDFVVKGTGQWKSSHSGATYPQGWTISIPRIGLETTVTATLPDQEFYESFLGSPIYWEGLCSVTGTRKGKPVGGEAYIELTSYKTP